MTTGFSSSVGARSVRYSHYSLPPQLRTNSVTCCMVTRRAAFSKPAKAVGDMVRCVCCFLPLTDNDPAMYNRQKTAGVDAIIMDDVAKLTKV
jgi:glycerophosphoryl diester phosphodiesterase